MSTDLNEELMKYLEMEAKHIHDLEGFFVGKKRYSITGARSEKGSGQIFLSQKFNKSNLDIVKGFLQLEMNKKDLYDPRKNYYITLEPTVIPVINPKKVRKMQTGHQVYGPSSLPTDVPIMGGGNGEDDEDAVDCSKLVQGKGKGKAAKCNKYPQCVWTKANGCINRPAEPAPAPAPAPVPLAAAFPLTQQPYDCPEGVQTVNVVGRVVPFYSEPAVSYCQSLIGSAMSNPAIFMVFGLQAPFELHKMNRPPVGHPRYANWQTMDAKMSLLTPANLLDDSYEEILVTHHLLHNALAHNGIEQEADLEEFYRMVQEKSLFSITVLHSLLHVYDALYMTNPVHPTFAHHTDFLQRYFDTFVLDDHERYCLYTFLNKNAGDFLVKNPAGEFVLPYTIVPAGIPSKSRQYGHVFDYGEDPNELRAEFRNQLRTNVPPAVTGSTNDLPNTA